VNLEAMAAGKAVLASRVGGVPEIVLDGKTGLLVPGDDAEALAQRLVQLSENSVLRAELGAAGAERAKKFDWSAIGAQYREIYERVGAQRPAPGATPTEELMPVSH
jgi:starch synthase